MSLALQLATWTLTDRATANTLYPDLVLPVIRAPAAAGAPPTVTIAAPATAAQAAVATATPVLRFAYEWKPLVTGAGGAVVVNTHVDMRISLDVQPVQLVLHAPVSPPRSVSLRHTDAAASRQFRLTAPSRVCVCVQCVHVCRRVTVSKAWMTACPNSEGTM